MPHTEIIELLKGYNELVDEEQAILDTTTLENFPPEELVIVREKMDKIHQRLKHVGFRLTYDEYFKAGITLL